MKTATTQYVEFDVSLLPVGHDKQRFVEVHGFTPEKIEPREIKPISFKGQVGEIEGYGQTYGDLFKEGSLTQGEAWGLFNAYLSARRGIWKPTPKQKEYLSHLFDFGDESIMETVIDFDNGDRSKPAKEGYKRVLMINRPKLLVVRNGVIKDLEVGDIEPKPKNWPANGYVGTTCDGPYDEDGVPFKTWPTREEAMSTWPLGTKENEVEDNNMFAGSAVSYAYSRNEGEGKAIVRRGFFYRGHGGFDLFADGDPNYRKIDVGHFNVSR